VTASKVTSFVATSYVRDLDRSRAFYAALGFGEVSSGRNELSAWSYLRHNGHFLLLATSEPALDVPQLPLHFYFFVEDLDATTRSLDEHGSPVEHVGYPPHALGGEARTLDPDGNTILVGQAERLPNQSPPPPTSPTEQFSLLREAAALARHRIGADTSCQIKVAHDELCLRPAEVKLADAWGDTAWACLPHAEETLINATGVFIANQDDKGLAPFLAARRKR
jgi:catechol 2,3-dioxygenase-like lactoylglutathione lyase family enzyme